MQKPIRIFSVTIVVIAIVSVFAQRFASAVDCVKSPLKFNYSRTTPTVNLELNSFVSLPNDVVIAGGHFQGGSSILHPALLVSEDLGGSWSSKILLFEGYGIEHLYAVGLTNIWAIITFQREGLHNPEYLMRSSDGGKNWCITPLSFIKLNSPLITVD